MSSVPISLVHQCKGHLVGVELGNNETYRGILVSADDALNITLSDATCTDKKGRSKPAGTTMLRGSMITLFFFPQELPLDAAVAAVVDSAAKPAASTAGKAGEKRSRKD